MQPMIYVADDEQSIRDMVRLFLESEGYRVRTFADGEALLEAFARAPCDLALLDVMMPGPDGFEVCRRLRAVSTVPIVMLTARDSDLDYAAGINLGSDDYFTKPFSAMSLMMRVKAIFRRVEYERAALPRAGVSFADLTIDMRAKQARLPDRLLDLSPSEFGLICYLVEHQDRAVPREELLDKLWGYDGDVETRAVDDAVRRLRKKLVGSRVCVQTVWGYGFRLKENGHE